mmetsp:Transcript_106952/g.279302  ORF Transcript_106952/g.279302 Transcript_106952/m.279302 type:complete len:204 (-) Transcript_106952:1359-1970(-)
MPPFFAKSSMAVWSSSGMSGSRPPRASLPTTCGFWVAAFGIVIIVPLGSGRTIEPSSVFAMARPPPSGDDFSPGFGGTTDPFGRLWPSGLRNGMLTPSVIPIHSMLGMSNAISTGLSGTRNCRPMSLAYVTGETAPSTWSGPLYSRVSRVYHSSRACSVLYVSPRSFTSSFAASLPSRAPPHCLKSSCAFIAAPMASSTLPIS